MKQTSIRAKSPRLFTFVSTLALALSMVLGVTGCDDGVAPDAIEPQPVGVVVNSVDNSLTIFPVEAPESSVTIGLGGDGTPVGAAVAGSLVVVPLGLTPAAAVVDLRQGVVLHTVALPQGSGATGAAFFGTDSALVANPQLNSVSVVDAAAGTAGPEIDVGPYPETIVAGGGFAYVVNRHLDQEFQVTGPGTITVIDLATLTVVDTIQLTGTNPGGAALSGDRLYVLNAGSWGEGNGSLSIVDTDAWAEIDHVTGFGDFPGSLTLGPDGQLYVSSYSYGIAIWDPASHGFVRSPDQPVQPNGVSAVSDVSFDDQERLYTLRPFCAPGEPDIAFRLTTGFEVDRSITVGNCPTAILFTEIDLDG